MTRKVYKIMKILSIGNSFSQDAQRYLRAIAKHHGITVKAVNLYIGGCPLRRHYINMLEDRREYDFEFCGEKTGIKTSIKEALISDEWDFVTLQQASPRSPDPDSYTPYIEALADYVRKYCPKTKLIIHQTWAYEVGTDRLATLGYDDPKAMMADVRAAYRLAIERICADGVIPSGDAMEAALELGIESVHRDGFHASLGVGRYILALTWLKTLADIDIEGESFNELDVEMSDAERALAIKAVLMATGKN